jgi:hypothetical protein
MLSIDIWSNAENTRDGAVLQYLFEGGSWETLVDPNENIASDSKEQIGLNWYNEKGLVSGPGNGIIAGTSGNSTGRNPSGYGWSGIYMDWKTASFPLDELRDRQLAGDGSLRFRIAFSSDQQNTVGSNYDGFAFDNLFVGERERYVLFEHFDNLNSNDFKIDSVNYLAQKFTLDLIPIQYHNNYPSEDIIYQNSKHPVETRGSIYDINQSPRSFMDGIKEYDYFGSHVRDYQIINRSLTDPLFDINIDVTPTGNSNSVEISVTITARDSLNEEIIVNVMPIETKIDNPEVNQPYGIDSLNNVVKDMLPQGGYPYSLSWSQGMSQNFTVTWDLNKLNEGNEIYDKTKLGVVVFVQNDVNEGTREVYQTGFEKLPELEKTVITGLEDELNVKKFEDATIYPNPAQNYFNVSLTDQLTMDLDWSIIDQRGIELLNGTFKAGEELFEIDTNRLPNGLHMFIIAGGADYKTIRKIIINR